MSNKRDPRVRNEEKQEKTKRTWVIKVLSQTRNGPLQVATLNLAGSVGAAVTAGD